MATLTYAGQKRAFVRPARTYDHYYDPIHYTSSTRDHMKESFKAQTGIDRIRYVPNFKTMFSTLRHYPKQRATLDMTDPVPSHISRQWQGFRDQARETIIRYKKMNYNPSIQVPPKHFERAYVTGKNRYKFFRRPIIPFLPQMPPNVVLAPARLDPLDPPYSASTEGGGRLFDGPKTRSVLVQTDYRDSDVQTDPYTPEYVVRPGSQPELLTLASLSYGRGLPAGLAEVEMIERARAKRAWEASLPPLDDLDRMDIRRKMMEEQERKEWAFREQEIDKMQMERLEVVQRMLQQREIDHNALNSKRMEHLWSKKQVEKDAHFRRLHSNHVKALRNLIKDCSSAEGKLQRHGVIEKYSRFDSQVYAPKTRIGVYLDSGSEQYNVKSKFTTTLDGLLELEDNLPQSALHSRMKSPARSAVKAIGMEARRQVKLGLILAQVHSEIVDNRTKGNEEEKPLRLLKKVEQQVPRPPTPTIARPKANVEEKELALVLIQRIIRGRAIQSKMFEGKGRRQQLIQELRTTHALQSPEQAIQKRGAEEIRTKQSEQTKIQNKTNTVQDGAEMPAASHLGDRLDFLTKELVRLQEERRVAAYVMLADRQRRIREADESGRRQREERVRRTEDEMFKQMMRVHQGSVDTYLEDVILKSMERTADDQARKEIAEKADNVNKLAYEFEYTELSGKELVAELVHSFLLPEVEKKTMKQKVEMNQRKHLLAAHRIILQTVDGIIPTPHPQDVGVEVTVPATHSPQSQQYHPVIGQVVEEVQRSTPQDEPAHHDEQGQVIYDDEQGLTQDITAKDSKADLKDSPLQDEAVCDDDRGSTHPDESKSDGQEPSHEISGVSDERSATLVDESSLVDDTVPSSTNQDKPIPEDSEKSHTHQDPSEDQDDIPQDGSGTK